MAKAKNTCGYARGGRVRGRLGLAAPVGYAGGGVLGGANFDTMASKMGVGRATALAQQQQGITQKLDAGYMQQAVADAAEARKRGWNVTDQQMFGIVKEKGMAAQQQAIKDSGFDYDAIARKAGHTKASQLLLGQQGLAAEAPSLGDFEAPDQGQAPPPPYEEPAGPAALVSPPQLSALPQSSGVADMIAGGPETGGQSLSSLTTRSLGRDPDPLGQYARGGAVRDYGRGGKVPKGKPGRDTIPGKIKGGPKVMLDNGEYVLPPAAVAAFGGKAALDAFVLQANGKPPVGYAQGGLAGYGRPMSTYDTLRTRGATLDAATAAMTAPATPAGRKFSVPAAPAQARTRPAPAPKAGDTVLQGGMPGVERQYADGGFLGGWFKGARGDRAAQIDAAVEGGVAPGAALPQGMPQQASAEPAPSGQSMADVMREIRAKHPAQQGYAEGGQVRYGAWQPLQGGLDDYVQRGRQRAVYGETGPDVPMVTDAEMAARPAPNTRFGAEGGQANLPDPRRMLPPEAWQRATASTDAAGGSSLPGEGQSPRIGAEDAMRQRGENAYGGRGPAPALPNAPLANSVLNVGRGIGQDLRRGYAAAVDQTSQGIESAMPAVQRGVNKAGASLNEAISVAPPVGAWYRAAVDATSRGLESVAPGLDLAAAPAQTPGYAPQVEVPRRMAGSDKPTALNTPEAKMQEYLRLNPGGRASPGMFDKAAAAQNPAAPQVRQVPNPPFFRDPVKAAWSRTPGADATWSAQDPDGMQALAARARPATSQDIPVARPVGPGAVANEGRGAPVSTAVRPMSAAQFGAEYNPAFRRSVAGLDQRGMNTIELPGGTKVYATIGPDGVPIFANKNPAAATAAGLEAPGLRAYGPLGGSPFGTPEGNAAAGRLGALDAWRAGQQQAERSQRADRATPGVVEPSAMGPMPDRLADYLGMPRQQPGRELTVPERKLQLDYLQAIEGAQDSAATRAQTRNTEQGKAEREWHTSFAKTLGDLAKGAGDGVEADGLASDQQSWGQAAGERLASYLRQSGAEMPAPELLAAVAATAARQRLSLKQAKAQALAEGLEDGDKGYQERIQALLGASEQAARQALWNGLMGGRQ